MKWNKHDHMWEIEFINSKVKFTWEKIRLEEKKLVTKEKYCKYRTCDLRNKNELVFIDEICEKFINFKIEYKFLKRF